MNCDWVRDHLSDYLEGELAASEQSSLESHLRDCPPCAAEDAALRQVVRLTALYGPQRAPRDCVASVMARLPAAAPLSKAKPSWLAGILSLRLPAPVAWPRVAVLAGLAAVCISAASLMIDRGHNLSTPAVDRRIARSDDA